MALKREVDVLVVGAGPVGQFAALSLAERGLSIEVIDREWRGASHSYALGLHPRSVQLLDEYGAAEKLLEEGHRVRRMAFYEGEQRVGTLDFESLPVPYPFLLIAPQSAVEHALAERLKSRKIKINWNHELMNLSQGPDGVNTRVALMEKHSTGYPMAQTEWLIAKEYDVRSTFVVGADGYHSRVRKLLGSRYEHHGESQTFSVYEFPCRIDFQHEARVVFHEGTTNVIWPLGEQHGRWSFQVPQDSPAGKDLQSFEELIRTRAPWFRSIGEIDWATAITFERRLVDRFGSDRVWLAGDAAHITGPVGIQSMNVGFREAHDLSEKLSAVHNAGNAAGLMKQYEAERQMEWKELLGISGDMRMAENAPEWSRRHAKDIVPCAPASGEELRLLLDQVGLGLPEIVAS